MAAILYRTTVPLIPDAATPTMSVGDGGGLLIVIRPIMTGTDQIGMITALSMSNVTISAFIKIQNSIGMLASQVNYVTKNPGP